MEEIILYKARKGEYAIPGWYLATKSDHIELLKKAVLDPLFWQSLGKACGWENEYHCPLCIHLSAPDGWVGFHFHAMEFYKINLTKGWSKAVEYLNSLIK